MIENNRRHDAGCMYTGVCGCSNGAGAKAVDDARFDERVACAALVLQASASSGQPQRDWAQDIAKAILARKA